MMVNIKNILIEMFDWCKNMVLSWDPNWVSGIATVCATIISFVAIRMTLNQIKNEQRILPVFQVTSNIDSVNLLVDDIGYYVRGFNDSRTTYMVNFQGMFLKQYWYVRFVKNRLNSIIKNHPYSFVAQQAIKLNNKLCGTGIPFRSNGNPYLKNNDHFLVVKPNEKMPELFIKQKELIERASKLIFMNGWKSTVWGNQTIKLSFQFLLHNGLTVSTSIKITSPSAMHENIMHSLKMLEQSNEKN
ncbi:hypothetical protein [Pediococcus argentinicus]|uniref:Uncharacterized protein n=1 Tax=Pediococcus argentinicus TaxID=480391 RepID=A0A0R2NJ33_9LACO|nr:hypothetical protein [Pediococcus argentinicus]KRO24866.1 hypothetical protein IV88_GL000695 [Pediococcus argentinicus]NKZ22666.1 hypothetical protein [Pediococcus argentinicus]GEP19694.1 hypothetical protein LSA03_10780 [Pediococcus argentinicus]